MRPFTSDGVQGFQLISCRQIFIEEARTYNTCILIYSDRRRNNAKCLHAINVRHFSRIQVVRLNVISEKGS